MEITPNEIFSNIKKNGSNISIFEEGINGELLFEFVEFLSNSKPNDFKSDDLDNDIDELFNENTSIERKKTLLVILSFRDDIKAYRAIEKYSKTADDELHSWSLMILQQSRMVIEGALTNENRIYVSSGMGGKGDKLRYMGVFSLENKDEIFSDFQMNLVKKEIEFTLNKNEGELENVEFYSKYITFTFLIPLDVTFIKILETVIDDCNEFGNFLSEDVFVTTSELKNESDIEELIKESIEHKNTVEYS